MPREASNGTDRTMTYALEIDAADVLGTAPGATLREIHDAYRLRVKKHHPDVGGDEWAFRAVGRAYELLSHARLRDRVAEWPGFETPANAGGPEADPFTRFGPQARDTGHAHVHGAEAGSHATSADDATFVRAGVEDAVDSPSKMVEIELFTIRYELSGPLGLIGNLKDRNLSSCLNIHWPAPPLHDDEPEAPADPATLEVVVLAFEAMPRRSKAVASWSRTDDGRFVGWLSYPTASQGFEAFETFHKALNDRGLGVRQSTRELFLAREPHAR